ncbi:MAG: hypothetical protein WC280_00990, partial [Patescibacteria group bacterium]
MKAKICLLSFFLISVFLLSSCESKSGKRVREVREADKILATKSDTLVFSPEKIGATNLVVEFIPYPKFDGGTG